MATLRDVVEDGNSESPTLKAEAQVLGNLLLPSQAHCQSVIVGAAGSQPGTTIGDTSTAGRILTHSALKSTTQKLFSGVTRFVHAEFYGENAQDIKS